MGMGDYIAAKDAEDENGRVDWDKVPARFGGRAATDKTGHPEDEQWWK